MKSNQFFYIVFLCLIGPLIIGGFTNPGYSSNSKLLLSNVSDSAKSKNAKFFISDSTRLEEDESDEYVFPGDPSEEKLAPPQLIDGIVDGYTDKQSYNPGDTVWVYLNAKSTQNNKRIYLYDIRMIKRDSVTTNVFTQIPSAASPWLDYGYSKTFAYLIPQNEESGIYNFGNKIFFIVKSYSKDAVITIIYPTNTEAAYNAAGGKSLYDFNSTNNKRVPVVSFHRPLSDHILKEVQWHSRPFMKWLAGLSGYSVQYISDLDMEEYSEIAKSKLLVVIGHSEYWSRKGRENFDKFVNDGNDGAVFSGNTMWWQVRYSSDHTKLICYKDASQDPETNRKLKTIEWPRASLNYPVLKSIGCDWPHGAYGMSAYHGKHAYTITCPNSPLLQGTGLDLHNTLSCQSYEYDATLVLGNNADGDPILDSTTLGFSKLEMLGYDWGQSNGAEKKGWGTFIVFRKTASSGIIVNTGFNTFTGRTPTYGTGGIAGPDSVKIRKIVLNIFNKLPSKQNIFGSCFVSAILASKLIKADTMLLYPNPGNGRFSINSDFDGYEKLVIRICNMYGQEVLTKNLEQFSENQVDLSGVSDGTYIYFIYSNNKLINRNKIILLKGMDR